MIRTLLTPEQQDISIRVPKNFVGKQVEVIAFTINDAIETSINTDQPLTHFASQQSLAKDWLTIEEDKAWQDL